MRASGGGAKQYRRDETPLDGVHGKAEAFQRVGAKDLQIAPRSTVFPSIVRILRRSAGSTPSCRRRAEDTQV